MNRDNSSSLALGWLHWYQTQVYFNLLSFDFHSYLCRTYSSRFIAKPHLNSGKLMPNQNKPYNRLGLRSIEEFSIKELMLHKIAEIKEQNEHQYKCAVKVLYMEHMPCYCIMTCACMLYDFCFAMLNIYIKTMAKQTLVFRLSNKQSTYADFKLDASSCN